MKIFEKKSHGVLEEHRMDLMSLIEDKNKIDLTIKNLKRKIFGWFYLARLNSVQLKANLRIFFSKLKKKTKKTN